MPATVTVSRHQGTFPVLSITLKTFLQLTVSCMHILLCESVAREAYSACVYNLSNQLMLLLVVACRTRLLLTT